MSKRSTSSILALQRKYATAEAIAETDATADELLSMHRKVVRPWTHKPGFRRNRFKGRHVYSIEIIPTGRYAPIWGYVDRGTKPHTIAAKNVPMLKFQTGYSARTAPVAKFNQGTGRASGAWVQKQEVQHPGTKARKFTETFVEDLRPPFPDRIQAAVQRGFRKVR